ncbi:MAG: DUF4338 domain-containing protein [Actinobacteria bacterium]|nr:DUF4338 domain-containing protein [Actinomycetota bacterium]
MVKKEIICLANSRKISGRCIAGKDLESFSWIRPISERDTHEISEEDRRYQNGEMPQLLDIIKINFMTDFKPLNQKPVGKLSGLVIKKVSNRIEAILWNEYVERYHYLKYTPLPGAQIRYIVSSDKEILALLGFGASAWMVSDFTAHFSSCSSKKISSRK